MPPVGPRAHRHHGLDVSDEAMAELLRVDVEEWRAQLPQIHEHFAQVRHKLPAELHAQLKALEARLG